MQFEELDPTNAIGWSLAHSLQFSGLRIPKGTVISSALAEKIKDAGTKIILAFQLCPEDIPENDAAEQIANHLAGFGIRAGKPVHGRCNLYAKDAGVFVASETINTLNTISPDIGIATLPNMAPVSHNKLIATVKVIPYGIPQQAISDIKIHPHALSVHSYKRFQASLLSSGSKMETKALSTTINRINHIGGTLRDIKNCPHTVSAVAAAIKELDSSDTNLILLSGISAISDERDILPTALKAVGGKVIHLGMPVDPGNLLMLGEINSKIVIGLPGCAKSPSLNGFDWVLERFAAGLPLDAASIQNMGIGGLLKETIDRPEPRAPAKKQNIRDTAVILLAAGRSSRSGNTHKLLATLEGKPVIEQSVITLKKSGFSNIFVITGARNKEINAALSNHSVTIIHNADFASGMGSSLATGVRALPEDTNQCIICLADMPFVSPATYKAMISAANKISESEIFTPIFKGKRGNPVLWRKSQFEQLSKITGDKGGRTLIRAQEDLVSSVTVDDPGILIDLDTPEALAQFGIKAAD